MRRYKNRSGRSGIQAFESGPEFIRIRFRDEDLIHIYNYTQPGKTDVEVMKRLAEAGRGLSTYISRYVRERYAHRQAV